MSVYIELVIFNNLAVDLFIGLSTLVIRRKRVGKFRLFLSAAVGAGVATAYAIAPKWGQILVKVLLAPLLVAILSKSDGKDFKGKFIDYLKTLACFCLVTYFVGGIIYGLSYALHIDVKSRAVLGITALACFLCLVCALAIAKKRSTSGKDVREVVLRVGGEEIKLKGLCDSGNLLVDDYSGLPVVILSKSACEKIGKLSVEGYINASTVSGQKCMPLVSLESVKVGQKTENALGALSDQVFGDYDVVLQNSMF